MYKLRLLDFVGDYKVHELPVWYEGPYSCLRYHAENAGYKFKPVSGYIYGGYFAHPETGDCLFITL